MAADPRRVKELFAAALDLAAGPARQEFLERECAGDAELRGRLEALLDAHDRPQPALDRPLAAHAADDEEQAGAVLAGKYKLVERIGEGGMGTVWMAQQTEPVRRAVAVKLIKDGGDSHSVLARFEAERQALALMDHPNIAKVLDAGATPRGAPFFVMELVKGVPITRFCDERRLTPRQRLELFVPVCQAIQHAHHKGVIHRDVKPSNVLVALYDDRPVPKVIDFGLAKAAGPQLTDHTLLTGFGALVGTPQYMSPEQATLNNLDIDTRSDIYSLGALLYEMLAGSPPFHRKELERAGVLEVLRAIREDEPPRPSDRVSTAEALPGLAATRNTEPAKLTRQLRGEIDWIVMKALEKDRSRRYETAAGFALDVQRYLADEPVQAGPPGAGYRLKKFVSRNRGRVTAAALVLLALVAGVVGTALGLVRAEGAHRDAVAALRREAERAEGERLAKLDAQAAAGRERRAKLAAQRAAEGEKQAKVQAQKRLKQIEKGVAILAAVFQDLDPKGEGRSDESLRVLLGMRLLIAAHQLEGEAVGDPLVVARLQSQLGISLLELGHYRPAEAVLRKALPTLEASLGARHRITLNTKHNLASLYRYQGKFPQAEKLFQEVLAHETAQAGPANQANILQTKTGLAAVYQSQGKYPQAEALLKEVLEDQAKLLPADHLNTLTTKNNLAILYARQGKYAQGARLLEQVLAGYTARVGPENPATLTAKSTLAAMYADLDKRPRAEKLLNEVLAIQTARLGAGHPHTLLTKNNLSEVYFKQGKYGPAESLLKEVMAGFLARLGPDHPDTLLVKVNLATLYRNQRKYPQAEAMYKEALAVLVAKQGGDSPQVLTTGFELAEAYRAQGKYALAEPLLNEVVAGRVAKLGADHPDTLKARYALARVYNSQNKLAEAEPQYRKVLAGHKARGDRAGMIVTQVDLALLYQSQGRYDRAQPLLESVLQTCVAALGVNHPQTLAYKHNVAELFVQQKKFARAEKLYREALEGRIVTLGADHLDTLLTRSKLAGLYLSLGKLDRCVPLFEQVVRQRKTKQGAGHLDTLNDLALLGVAYREAGRLEDGIRRLEEALAALRKRPAPVPANLAWVPGQLAQTYDRAKQYAKSEPLYREFLEQGRRQFGADDPRTAGLMAQLALNLLAQKKYPEAEKALRDCLAVRDKKQPDAWGTFNAKSMLGEGLLGQKKYAEAGPLLEGGYRGMKQRREQIPAVVRQLRLTEALRRLVALSEATGDKEAAAKWRKELEAVKPPARP